MLVFDKRVKSEYPEKNTRGRVGIPYHVAELKLKATITCFSPVLSSSISKRQTFYSICALKQNI